MAIKLTPGRPSFSKPNSIALNNINPSRQIPIPGQNNGGGSGGSNVSVPIVQNTLTGEVQAPVASTQPNASYEQNYTSVFQPVATANVKPADNQGFVYKTINNPTLINTNRNNNIGKTSSNTNGNNNQTINSNSSDLVSRNIPSASFVGNSNGNGSQSSNKLFSSQSNNQSSSNNSDNFLSSFFNSNNQKQRTTTVTQENQLRQNKIQNTIESNTPFKKNGNALQETGYYVLGAPASLLSDVRGGADSLFYLGGEFLRSPQRRQEVTQSFLQNSAPILKETPLNLAESFSLLTRSGSFNPQGALSILTIGEDVNYKSPLSSDVRVGGSFGSVSADLTGESTLDLSQGQVAVGAGGREFLVDVNSVGLTKADADGSFVRTGKSEFLISEPATGAEFTSYARSEEQLFSDESGVRSKGTFGQVTNTGKGKAVYQPGRFGGIAESPTYGESLGGAGVELGSAVRVSPVSNIQDFSYGKEVLQGGPRDPINNYLSSQRNVFGGTKPAAFETTLTRQIAEGNGPLNPAIADFGDVQVSGVTRDVNQRMSETFFEGVGGKGFKEFSLDLKNKGYSFTKTESGVPVVDFQISQTDQYKMQRVRSQNPSGSFDQPTPLLKQSNPLVNNAPLVSQARNAVENILSNQNDLQLKSSGSLPTSFIVTNGFPKQSTAQATSSKYVANTFFSGKTDQQVLTSSTLKIGSNQFAGLGSLYSQRQSQDSKFASLTGTLLGTRSKSMQSSEQLTEQATLQDTLQSQIQDQVQEQVLQQQYKQIARQSFATPKYLSLNTRLPIKLVPQQKSFKFGFDVFVRRHGKFKKVSSNPLNFDEARSYGAKLVGNSAAATFKLVETGATTLGSFSGYGNLSDFYKKNGSYIEKRSRRIKSGGELQEITYQGVLANQRKARSKKRRAWSIF